MATGTSEKLQLIVERDGEGDWDILAASYADGSSLSPKDGFRHKRGCACRAKGSRRLCDIGWLEEFLQSVGADYFEGIDLEDVLPEGKPGILVIVGHLESWETNTPDGYDCDEAFEVDSVRTYHMEDSYGC